jgi:hypothetical protein
MLCGKIFYACKQIFWNDTSVELSELKAMKFLARNKELIHDLLFGTKEMSELAMKKIDAIFRNTCIKEFKKHHKTPMNIIKYHLS